MLETQQLCKKKNLANCLVSHRFTLHAVSEELYVFNELYERRGYGSEYLNAMKMQNMCVIFMSFSMSEAHSISSEAKGSIYKIKTVTS